MRSDLISAFMLLTRVPVRGRPTDPAAAAAWAWPVVGLLPGGVTAALLFAGLAVGLLPGAAAAIALAAGITVTGALHEDGLADVADGFWGGFTITRRLEIMRDSQLGSYGVITLVVSILGRWALLVAVAQAGLWWAPVAAAVASRAAMPVMMRLLPPARTDGLSRGAGVPPPTAVAIGVALGALALVPYLVLGLAAAAAIVALTFATSRVARAKIGGQTGDTCGAVQQLSEIAVLAVLTTG